MKKLIQLSCFIGLFLIATPQISAQNAHQQVMWEQAHKEVNSLATSLALTPDQQTKMERFVYDYHARNSALKRGVKHLDFNSKKEITALLYKKLSAVLTTDQLETFKSVKSNLLDSSSSNTSAG